MREVVQYLLPAPYVAPPPGGKGKGVKPLLSERQIEELVQGAMVKDADVSGTEMVEGFTLTFLSRSAHSSNSSNGRSNG